ncbi:MAG: M20/M25/M40 family metallo-hydrolase [Cyclobacteriaceae bacterium]|nr:M20/M25/M40 family metallo-hydrolase [Cyclobacteriaceae bacterium]
MKYTTLFLLLFVLTAGFSQSSDESTIRKIYDKALSEGKSYAMLDYLCNKIGARLSGSPGAAAAVEWSRHTMEDFGFDSVWLQPVMVPHWVRGQAEIGRILNSKKMGTVDVAVCALGGSVGTGPEGISAGVIEVKSFEELAQLGQKHVQGKLVFFNRPMDPNQLQTFAAYGGAVNQRGSGAVEAAKYGAAGVIVRSMGINPESYPHTGGMRYATGVPMIPAIAISTQHADLLSRLLKEDKGITFYMETHCQILDDAPSFNVIGEIKGGEFSNEIIAIGGHLDSWDLGQGAHDDGAGCVQSIEILRIFKTMGYKPKRTIRAVMFMNEENGLRGGQKYAELALKNGEKHIAAMESDRGGFTPRGFTISAPDPVRKKIQGWKGILEPYGLSDFSSEGGGADIGPLAPQGVTLIGYLPDSQRYFNYHHTAEDTFDKVDKRELELGSASMAALVYLIDQHGLK